MRSRRKPTPGTEPVRTFPYYKIQVWEDKRAVWLDIQKKFFTLEDLRVYAQKRLNRTDRARVMVVEGYGSRRVDDSLSPFGD